MEHITKYVFALLLVLVIGGMPVHAADKKDPYLRDDDISRTTVSMEVSRNELGLFVYKYDLVMPVENTGAVRTFRLDISCADVVPSLGFNADDFPSDASRSFSADGKHVPVAIDAPWGQSGMFGISEGNAVHWGVVGKPGTSKMGLQLISPYPPGAREYRLVPNMRYREEEYDYSGVAEDDDTVPWTDDFTITGTTTGPACPGEEYPDSGDDGDDKRFPGSRFRGESVESNELLTYSAPLRDHLHVPAGTKELEMTIHYHEAIDPRTFQVTPNKNHLRKLFNPKPGTSETVRIPLEKGKNRIQLQVQGMFEPQRRKTKPMRFEHNHKPHPPKHGPGNEQISKDRDVFLVRVARDEVPPGKRDKEHRKP
jgi:hypothetical protein